jgi:uncharacterized membrane protein YkvI
MKSKGLLFWQVAFTYIGAVIGAGFASGQEIMRFFTRFGCWGAVGALLAGGFLAFLGYAVITRAAYYNMNSFDQSCLPVVDMAGCADYYPGQDPSS